MGCIAIIRTGTDCGPLLCRFPARRLVGCRLRRGQEPSRLPRPQLSTARLRRLKICPVPCWQLQPQQRWRFRKRLERSCGAAVGGSRPARHRRQDPEWCHWALCLRTASSSQRREHAMPHFCCTVTCCDFKASMRISVLIAKFLQPMLTAARSWVSHSSSPCNTAECIGICRWRHLRPPGGLIMVEARLPVTLHGAT